jgi:hypothetical protein
MAGAGHLLPVTNEPVAGRNAPKADSRWGFRVRHEADLARTMHESITEPPS